jgi:hypothetical protein
MPELHPLKPSAGGGDFDSATAGIHPAVLVRIINLGTHPHQYRAKTWDDHDIYLVFELLDQFQKSAPEQHLLFGARFAYKFTSKSPLRLLVEGWRGKAYSDEETFFIQQLLGRKCQVNIVTESKDGRTYTKLDKVLGMPKGATFPDAQLKPLLWEPKDGKIEDLQDLPWIYGKTVKEIVEASPEWKERVRGSAKSAGNGAAPHQANGSTTHKDSPTPAAAEQHAEEDVPF